MKRQGSTGANWGFALITIFCVVLSSQTQAWTRSHTESLSNEKRDAELQARTRATARLRAATIAKSQYQIQRAMHARAAVQSRTRDAFAALQRARASQADQLDRETARVVSLSRQKTGSSTTALALQQKWAARRSTFHVFQGIIPPEELRRFEPPDAPSPVTPALQNCANLPDGMPRDTYRDCKVPSS